MQLTEKSAPDTVGANADRSQAPVFVLGCGRSGTTLLYHMILSAGDFAVYRTESNVINLLEPRFGNLSIRRNREKLMDAWINSKLFWVSGLNADEIRNKVLQECRNGGDFLRIIMGEMARQQGVRRWADCTPEHLLYMPRIKETIPDALIIHIIRDGRDVALSTDKLGYIKRAPWDNMPSVMVAGLYWEWMVRRGREDGRKLGNADIEEEIEAFPKGGPGAYEVALARDRVAEVLQPVGDEGQVPQLAVEGDALRPGFGGSLAAVLSRRHPPQRQ